MMGGTAHLDDVVLAVLQHLRSKSRTFTANREAIHRAFFALKDAFPEQLAPLTFRDKGFFPESLGLDQAFANLEASRFLHRQNQAPLFYEIDPGIDASYEKFVKGRLHQQGLSIEETHQIAERLNEELSTALAS